MRPVMEAKEETSDTDSGIILHSGPDSPCSMLKEVNTHTRAVRLKLTALEERLDACVSELKQLCIREAELTGVLSPDYPLLAGERPPQIRRRIGAAFKIDQHTLLDKTEDSLSAVEVELACQQQIVVAVRGLVQEGALVSSAMRRTRQQQVKHEEKKLRQLQEEVFKLRLQHGRNSPLPAIAGHRDPPVSDDSSLSDSALLDDEERASQASQPSLEATHPHPAKPRPQTLEVRPSTLGHNHHGHYMPSPTRSRSPSFNHTPSPVPSPSLHHVHVIPSPLPSPSLNHALCRSPSLNHGPSRTPSFTHIAHSPLPGPASNHAHMRNSPIPSPVMLSHGPSRAPSFNSHHSLPPSRTPSFNHSTTHSPLPSPALNNLRDSPIPSPVLLSNHSPSTLSPSPAALEADRPPIEHSPWEESSLDTPYQKKKSRSSSRKISPAVTETLPPLEVCVSAGGSDAGSELCMSDVSASDVCVSSPHAALRVTHSNSAPCTPDMALRRGASLRLPSVGSGSDVAECHLDRGRSRSSRRRLIDVPVTPDTLPLQSGMGNPLYCSSSEDSASEHSASSYCSSSATGHPPQPRPPPNGFYRNPNHQSSPSFNHNHQSPAGFNSQHQSPAGFNPNHQSPAGFNPNHQSPAGFPRGGYGHSPLPAAGRYDYHYVETGPGGSWGGGPGTGPSGAMPVQGRLSRAPSLREYPPPHHHQQHPQYTHSLAHTYTHSQSHADAHTLSDQLQSWHQRQHAHTQNQHTHAQYAHTQHPHSQYTHTHTHSQPSPLPAHLTRPRPRSLDRHRQGAMRIRHTPSLNQNHAHSQNHSHTSQQPRRLDQPPEVPGVSMVTEKLHGHWTTEDDTHIISQV
ncbi:innate immunity activator b isoform X2 [Engraulis encrasicolus]|uniref:innate immunity activator b isoform X2 n=1 Tax=Engraulis encrasicolus TaxID=184585 RepID=UPI002FD17D1A